LACIIKPCITDVFILPHNKNGIYSAKSGYSWLLFHHVAANHQSVSWSWIWRLKVPEKIKFLVWLACHDAVPTLTLLNHMNMVSSPSCTRCGDQDETFFHCIWDCRFSMVIWQKIGFSSQHFFSSTSAQVWLKEGANSSQSILFLSGLWWIWKHCNLMCLGNETLSLTKLCSNIYSLAESIKTTFIISARVSQPDRFTRWNNNNHQCTILNVDGSCNGDPIRTGFGGTFWTQTSSFISGFSGHINHSHDILYVELTALYQGLLLAINMNHEVLACYTDSLVIVNLINEDSNHYHVYAVLIQNIKDIIISRNYSLQHSLREGDQCADFMAKLGASNDVDLEIHSSPPEGLLPLLQSDELGMLFLRR